MAGLNETPRGNRIHVAFFGLRNAGKSTLVNAFTGQRIAIVSDVAGTTTDPVSKAMEILPLGPCLVTDTAGLDDEGDLGQMRVRKSLDVLATTDIAVWVEGGSEERGKREEERGTGVEESWKERFLDECRKRQVVVLEFRRGDDVGELKRKIAAVKLEDRTPGLLEGLVAKGDRVLCVVPIDESAPKGRLILPQQQVIRECLDIGAIVTVCQPGELESHISDFRSQNLFVTDSQAFGSVRQTLERIKRSNNPNNSDDSNNSNKPIPRLTSFSILFARQKGDLAEYVKGLGAIKELKDGDTVLIAEGCTHHRQCNDIGAVKIPKALQKLSGRSLNFVFSSGTDFLPSSLNSQLSTLNSQPSTLNPQPSTLNPQPSTLNPQLSLVVHCGGCMLTRREVLRRIGLAKEAGLPIVNYGMVLAAVNGLKMEDVLV